MSHLRTVMILLSAVLLSACGSTPQSDYYMLTADACCGPVKGQLALGVGPVSIPDYLKTRKIVMNRNDHLLKLAEYDRWAEPLDAGVSRVVAVNLAILLDTNRVQTFPWRRDAVPEYAIRVSVIQFAAQDNEALMVAEWEVTRPKTGESVDRAIDQITTRLAGNEPENVAEAYSDLLLKFSENIAVSVRKQTATGP